MDGANCSIVAHNDERKLQRVAWHIPPRFVQEFEQLEVGSRVEVLLDTGVVVETATRSKPWNIRGGDASGALIQLVDFTGGFSLTRVRPLGWPWSRRSS